MNHIVKIDEKLCTGCGKCVRICPQQILSVDEMDRICKVVNEKKCDRLKGCEYVCPMGAIKVR